MVRRIVAGDDLIANPKRSQLTRIQQEGEVIVCDGDGWKITVGLGRKIHDNGQTGADHEYLCFADGRDGRRYNVHVQDSDGTAVATVEGMPGRVKLQSEIELTQFYGFSDYPKDCDPEVWLQGLIDKH